MAYEMSVTYMGYYVEVNSSGDKSIETALQLWREITRVCNQHHCYKILGIARSTRPMPVMDSISHEKLFKDLQVTHRYKVAWVELNPAAVDKTRFLETFVQNRSLVNGRLFEDVATAKQWLLSD